MGTGVPRTGYSNQVDLLCDLMWFVYSSWHLFYRAARIFLFQTATSTVRNMAMIGGQCWWCIIPIISSFLAFHGFKVFFKVVFQGISLPRSEKHPKTCPRILDDESALWELVLMFCTTPKFQASSDLIHVINVAWPCLERMPQKCQYQSCLVQRSGFPRFEPLFAMMICGLFKISTV